MRSRRLDKSLRWLLATLLLSSGLSLGIRHAHPGGDRAHHHHGRGLHGLGHHDLGHRHREDGGLDHDSHAACSSTDVEASASPRRGHSHHTRAREVLASAPLHRHVFFLGFEFTLTGGAQTPDDSPTDGSREKIPSAGQDMLVRLVSGELPNVSAVTFPAASTWDVARIASLAAMLVDRPSPERGRMTAVARPLCDAARHERSGVQLM